MADNLIGTGGPATTATKIAWPAGVTPGAGRETAETDYSGQVHQGIRYPFRTPLGTNSSVFIPYSDLSSAAKAESIIAARVNAVLAIEP